MTESQRDIYRHHHQTNRERGFSILKEDRGKLLKELIGEGHNVLDIGCRDGALTKYFTKDNKVLGVDIDDVALEDAKKSLGIEAMKVDLNGDWSELKDRKFDIIVAGEVLEHLYYPEKVVGKVGEHLVSGGMFVGSVPNTFSLKNRFRLFLGMKKHTPLGDPTHINHFHIKELRLMLKEHFIKVEIRGLGRYGRLARISPGFFGFDLFFVCIK